MVKYNSISLQPNELIGGGPRQKPRPKQIFVAYSFGDNGSCDFVEKLKSSVRKFQRLSRVVVTDGSNIEPGKEWAKTIRQTISSASLVIGEMSAHSPEVFFECGFAYGLGKKIFIAVATDKSYNRLPRWLTKFQVCQYEDEPKWNALIDNVDKFYSRERSTFQRDRSLTPDPGQSIWIPGEDWYESRKETLEHSVCVLNMLDSYNKYEYDNFEENGSSILHAVMESSLVVSSVCGKNIDNLTHFVSGIVTSKQRIGTSKTKLSRKMIIVCKTQWDTKHLVSDAARRSRNVTVITPDQLVVELGKFGDKYNEWKRKCDDNATKYDN